MPSRPFCSTGCFPDGGSTISTNLCTAGEPPASSSPNSTTTSSLSRMLFVCLNRLPWCQSCPDACVCGHGRQPLLLQPVCYSERAVMVPELSRCSLCKLGRCLQSAKYCCCSLNRVPCCWSCPGAPGKLQQRGSLLRLQLCKSKQRAQQRYPLSQKCLKAHCSCVQRAYQSLRQAEKTAR